MPFKFTRGLVDLSNFSTRQTALSNALQNSDSSLTQRMSLPVTMTTLYNPGEYYKLDEVDCLKDIYRKARSKRRNWVRGKSRTSTTTLSVLRQRLAEDKKRSKPDVQARQQTLSFQGLPPEIRNYIYELALVKAENLTRSKCFSCTHTNRGHRLRIRSSVNCLKRLKRLNAMWPSHHLLVPAK